MTKMAVFPYSKLLKHPTQNQLVVGGAAAQTHIRFGGNNHSMWDKL